MQLKNYQRAALEKLERFLEQTQLRGAAQAFAEVAAEDGNPYANDGRYTPLAGVGDCPYVCLRLPTGGGKTLLAALSIARAARYLQREFPVVLWMTPSDAIRKQTVEALKNPRHPYRAALDADFGGRVEVWDIEQWRDLRPADMSERVCVVVSTIQALRITDTNRRKVYAHNENLEAHFTRFAHAGLDLEKNDDGGVKFSFANLLHIHRPVVIVDEAHNAVTGLTAELHQRLRPGCVVEFTATPRGRNNVLVNVPATALRDEEMIKLPIVLTEHKTWEDAVNGAIGMRKLLAEVAREEKERIRPVILYQAQDKNRDVTVEALKKYLVNDEQIPPEKIAVATGDQRELDDIDLDDPQCPVEHVITVQALKEGWDCPFAYVLCSVANVKSATSVEQLLGRVMRMPFARRRKHGKLNRAYVHVPETDFAQSAHALREKLVDTLGFEEYEADNAVQDALFDPPEEPGGLSEPWPEEVTVDRKPDWSACTDDEREEVKTALEIVPLEDGKARVIVKNALPETALTAIVESVADAGERAKVRHRLLRKNLEFKRFHSPARRGVNFGPLPRLFFVFDGDELEASPENINSTLDWNPLGQDCVLSESEFNIVETATSFKIDFGANQPAELGKLEIGDAKQWRQPEFLGRPEEVTGELLAAWLERRIATLYLTQEVLREIAQRNVDALVARGHSLAVLARFKFLLQRSLSGKLHELRRHALAGNYRRRLFSGEAPVLCKWQFEFSPDPVRYEYNYVYTGPYRFKKHYYGLVGDLKNRGEEHQCAMALEFLPEVACWIRNVDRKPNSFWLPRPHNKFYPDFIARLTDGRMLVVEYKGKHLVTAKEAKERKFIGELWQRKSEGKALFLMPTKERGAPDVREQIAGKINAPIILREITA